MASSDSTSIVRNAASAAILVLLYAALRGNPWRGTAELHTNIEIIASTLALIVGFASLIRFYARKNNTYLFIGAGFIGTGILDAYHAVVTSVLFAQFVPSPPPSLIPWSWNASRTFLALLILMSYWAWKRERRRLAAGRIRESIVYVTIGILTLICFGFFAFVPLPTGYYPKLPFGRPQEFVAAALFLAALISHFKKGIWRSNHFETGLLSSLLLAFIAKRFSCRARSPCSIRCLSQRTC